MSAQLGFSFRWVYQMPDIGVTFDSFGRPHSAIFVANYGDAPARHVEFRGRCAVLAEPPDLKSVRICLAHLPWSVPKSAFVGQPPLWYQFDGDETVGSGTLYGFGEVIWTGRNDIPDREQFCCVWRDGAWQTVAL